LTAVALIEAESGRIISHNDLSRLSREFAASYCKSQNKQLFLLVTTNTIATVVALRGILESGNSVLLADRSSPPGYVDKLVSLYTPEWIIAPPYETKHFTHTYDCSVTQDYSICRAQDKALTEIHPDLAVLLTTSGSTGSPKLVRLSYNNIHSNNEAIIEALNIQTNDRAVAHLSMAYSFGLSVINTHLHAGASLLLVNQSMTETTFWELLRNHNATSLPGVPYHFELIYRLGMERLKIPTIRTLTQAGGSVPVELVHVFVDIMVKRKGQFFVMYGQTEASPRITVLDATNNQHKIGSTGRVLKGGEITIINDEIIYTGANVMLGYAECRADLSHGDTCQGRLSTGDLGHLDSDSFLYITGRKSRIAKINGSRVNLDEVENMASLICPTAVIEHNGILLFVEEKADAVRAYISTQTSIPPSHIHIRQVASIPRQTNQKIDYQALREMVT